MTALSSASLPLNTWGTLPLEDLDRKMQGIFAADLQGKASRVAIALVECLKKYPTISIREIEGRLRQRGCRTFLIQKEVESKFAFQFTCAIQIKIKPLET